MNGSAHRLLHDRKAPEVHCLTPFHLSGKENCKNYETEPVRLFGLDDSGDAKTV